jgi:integrase/recombinase XerD
MSIKKGPTTNTWYLTISRGRKLKPVHITFHGTEVEARATEREMKGVSAPADSKIIDLVPAYLVWYQLNRLPRSYNEINDTLKRLLPHFGSVPAAYLSTHHIEEYKALRRAVIWRGKQISRVTINRELKHLMAMLRWAAKEKLIPPVTVTPQFFSAAHQEEEARPIDVLSADELAQLFKNLDGPTAIIYKLLFWCGLRASEATHLTVRQVDLARGMLLIEGKGGRKRPAAIPLELIPELTAAIKGKQPGNLVAPNELTGFPYGDLRTPLETAARKAGITKRVHPHGLRHSHGTALILAGASLPEVQDSLGHRDMSTTRRYIHLAAENLTRQSARLSVWMAVRPEAQKPEAEQIPVNEG